MLDAFFPIHCAGCGLAQTALCAACGPQPEEVRSVWVGGIRVRAVARYAGLLRRAILAFKRGRRDHGDALATLLAERTAAELPRRALLVPIPTVARRRRQRGFDQSVRLAREVGERSGLPVVTALRQLSDDAQRGRSRGARLLARGRFACAAPELVDGALIVLVDDVVTTGATLADAAQTLRACGARVHGAVVLAYV